jgi:flagellar biosynthetic protein FlhB
MSDDSTDDSQKTEEPTQKKLDDSRKKGQVPLSKETNNWVMLLAGTIVVVGMGGSMMSDLSHLFTALIQNSYQLHGAAGGLRQVLTEVFMATVKSLSLPILFLMVAALLSSLVQVGPMLSPQSIKPSLEKISVMKGFTRLFSMRSLFEFFKGILKIILIATVSVILLYPFFGTIDHFVGLPIYQMLAEFKVMLLRLMSGILVVLAVLAIIDIVYQRAEHMKKMRMSRKEITDEQRQTDGDPHMKAKLRQLRMQKAQQRMMQSVPEATVVITNPTHYAIALKYDGDTMDAPVCLAKGTDEVALRIREVATENDVRIVENKPLARAMYDAVEIDEIIPVEHYKAVAEVISYVMGLKR